MRISFVSNYFNHHQLPISDAFFELTDGQYRFFATQHVPQERIALGWDMGQLPGYVFEAPNGHLSKEDSSWLMTSDILLFGSAPERLLKSYLSGGGLAYRYSERPLKDGDVFHKRIPRWVRWHINNPMRSRLYLLSAGAYAASDYSRYGLFRERSYKWGYFPPLENHEDVELLFDCKKPASLLWCGRFIEWKHPDLAIDIAASLKEAGYVFDLTMIGAGPMEADLHKKVENLSLEACVHIVSPCSNAEIRQAMNKTQVFLFTSDRKEGWGAVLNEAMGGMCAVVASGLAGSTSYLVQDGLNGIVCTSLDAECYAAHVARLLDDAVLRKSLSLAAHQTIMNTWNARIASRRLLELSHCILNGVHSPSLFDDGPCSKADWRPVTQ